MRRFVLLSILVAAAAAIGTRAAAQDSASSISSETFVYEGMIPIGDGAECTTIWFDRDQLVERAGEAPEGWRYFGDAFHDNSHEWYHLYGTTLAGSDVARLTLGRRPDSIVGYLEGRVDGSDRITLLWRGTDGDTPVPCTMILSERSDANDDGVFETEFVPFWKRFRDAVHKRDAKALSAMTRFPIASTGCLVDEYGPDVPDAIGRGKFARSFATIFDESMTDLIESTDALELDTHIQGADPAEESGYDIPGIGANALVYVITYHGHEYQRSFCFARVKGKFKLVHCDCAG